MNPFMNHTFDTDDPHPELDRDHRTFFFPLFCLVMGLILDAGVDRFKCRRFSIPSTVFQLSVSIIISATAHFFLAKNTLQDIAEKFTWKSLDPEIIMTVLLPIIVFESGFKMEAHTLKAHIGPVLVLAIVGFLVSAALLGGLMYTTLKIIGQDWTIPAAFAYGTLMSATDPVAVVALLDELGAPIDLTVLIEGESLLNDGAAIFCFGLLENLMVSQDQKIEWTILIPTKFAGVVGSCLIGYIATRLVVWLLLHAFIRDIKKDIGILFGTVYMVYALSECIKGSGVVALVIFGVSLSSRKEQMNPETVEEIAHLYTFLAYWANCMIFILTGLIIGELLQEVVESPDLLGIGVVTYILCMLSRACVVAIYGLLNFLRQKYLADKKDKDKKEPKVTSLKQYFFIIWAGLRGAVALLLALHLHHNEHLTEEKQEIRHVMLFAGMTVLFSIVLQGTLAAPFIRCLALADRSRFARQRLRHHLENLENDTLPEVLMNLKSDEKFYFLGGANWEVVERIAKDACLPFQGAHLHEPITGLPPESSGSRTSLKSVTSRRTTTSRKSGTLSPADDSESSLRAEETVRVFRTYLYVLLARTWRMWKEGLLNKSTIRLLVHSIEHDMENGEALKVDKLLERAECSCIMIHIARFLQRIRSSMDSFGILVIQQQARSRDWFYILSYGLLMTHCGLVVAFFWAEKLELLYAIFLLSLVFIVEQVALFFRLFHVIKDCEWKRDIWIYLDFPFALYYLVLVFLTGFALRKEGDSSQWECFHFHLTTSKVFKEEDPVCATTKYFLLGAFLRFFIRSLFCFRLLLQLLAEQTTEYVASRRMMKLASLNAIIRITEELDHGALVACLPDNTKMAFAASQENKMLRDIAESLLLQDLCHHPMDLNLIRLVQTRQASRGVVVSLKARINKMSVDGRLTEEEYHYMEERLMVALSRVEGMTEKIGQASLKSQLLRVPWIAQPKGDCNSRILLDFLDGSLKRMEHLKARDPVYDIAEKVNGIFFLKEGLCLAESGKDHSLRLIYPGSFFGHRTLLSHDDSQVIQRVEKVTLATDCTLYQLSLDDVRELKKLDPTIEDSVARREAILKCCDEFRKSHPYKAWTRNQLERFVEEPGRFHQIKSEATFPATRRKPAIVLSGIIRKESEEEGQMLRATEAKAITMKVPFSIEPVKGENAAFLFYAEDIYLEMNPVKESDGVHVGPLKRVPSTELTVRTTLLQSITPAKTQSITPAKTQDKPTIPSRSEDTTESDLNVEFTQGSQHTSLSLE